MGHTSKHEPKITIRGLRQEDIDGVLAIDRKIVGTQRALSYATTPGSYVGGELDMSVVAEANGEIVGFLLGRIADSPHGVADYAWLNMIGVDPGYRRQGIGRRLVEAFEECCRQRGASTIHVMVNWHDWWLLSFLGSLEFGRGDMAEFVKYIES